LYSKILYTGKIKNPRQKLESVQSRNFTRLLSIIWNLKMSEEIKVMLYETYYCTCILLCMEQKHLHELRCRLQVYRSSFYRTL